jgi:hypothetical protein
VNLQDSTLDNERFFVEYSDGQNRWEPFVLYFNVAETSIARFWKECLLKNYIGPNNNTNDSLLDKRYMQRGFATSWNDSFTRNVEVACKEMNHAISIINEGLNPLGYPNIDLNFTIEALQDKNIYRDMMNCIHHHFEILIGQVWDVSQWYLNANNKTRWAIHQINNHCHEIEAFVDSINYLQRFAKFTNYLGYNPGYKPSYGTTGINFSCDQQRDGVYRGSFIYYELTDEHCADFTPVEYGWGVICPYYSQLGKTPREAFHDNDEYIDKKNITATRFMTGECNIELSGPGVGQGKIVTVPLEGRELKFKVWLESNGWDYHDPKLCIGTAVMGMVDFSLYPGLNWNDLDFLVKRCDNVTEIGFVDVNMNKKISKRYDYTWQEQHAGELKFFGLNNPHENV